MLRDYAEFWKIPYTMTPQRIQDSSSSTIFTTALPTEEKDSTIIVSPCGTEQFDKTARELGLSISSKLGLIKLPVAKGVEVSLRTMVYEFSGTKVESVLQTGKTTLLSRIRGTRIHLLSVDLLGEYSKHIYGGIEDHPSWKFRLVSKLPRSYQSIPKFIRERSLQSGRGLSEITEDRLSPVECLRTIFLASLVKVSGPIRKIGFWRRGKSYALLVTHDVETHEGLEKGAPRILRVERDLEIRSTWNIPSDRFLLSPETVRALGDSAEIGGHDTKHDGRLLLVDMEAKARRLTDCREKLEKLTNRPVRGFRAPLLQHSSELVAAVAKAGFGYDSSCPSWEILSPTSLQPHGVGSIFPFEVSGILEIPVSLPQDHQLIRVAGQNPSEAVDTLLRLSRWIRRLGGPCVLLVHPDYELGMVEWESEYRRLLEYFASDATCDIMTLGQMADWWQYRSRSKWSVTDSPARIVAPDMRGSVELQAEMVTEYQNDGFIIEPITN
jgi:peptidoglycan/xylan/chitin deacetylase (PgdA/CDA1 family)